MEKGSNRKLALGTELYFNIIYFPAFSSTSESPQPEEDECIEIELFLINVSHGVSSFEGYLHLENLGNPEYCLKNNKILSSGNDLEKNDK